MAHRLKHSRAEVALLREGPAEEGPAEIAVAGRKEGCKKENVFFVSVFFFFRFSVFSFSFLLLIKREEIGRLSEPLSPLLSLLLLHH